MQALAQEGSKNGLVIKLKGNSNASALVPLGKKPVKPHCNSTCRRTTLWAGSAIGHKMPIAWVAQKPHNLVRRNRILLNKKRYNKHLTLFTDEELDTVFN